MLFENESDLRLLFLIGHIWENARRWMQDELRPMGITYPQFGALCALSQDDRITQKELSGMLNAGATTVMVICDSLEKKSLIQRLPDPSDRRVNRLTLTDAGRETVARAYPQIRDGCKDALSAASASDLRTTVQLLEGIREVLGESL